MVRALKIISVAAAIMMNAASAFTAPRSSTSWGASQSMVQSRPLSPSPLQATTISMSDTFTPVGAGPAILDRPAVEKRRRKSRDTSSNPDMADEKSILRIYNDAINTREYVARCLVQVVGLSEDKAFDTMMAAHSYGIAVVGKYVTPTAQTLAERLCVSGVRAEAIQIKA